MRTPNETRSRYISQNFVPVEENSVTVWIALDDADAETGVVLCHNSSVSGSRPKDPSILRPYKF